MVVPLVGVPPWWAEQRFVGQRSLVAVEEQAIVVESWGAIPALLPPPSTQPRPRHQVVARTDDVRGASGREARCCFAWMETDAADHW